MFQKFQTWTERATTKHALATQGLVSLCRGYNYDSTSSRRISDCLSKVIKVTVTSHGPLTR